MTKIYILIALAFSVLLAGCGKFKILRQEFQPVYACTDDDLWVSVEVNKKIDRIRLLTANGTILTTLHKEKVIEYTHESVQPSDLQFTVSLKKNRKVLPDVKKHAYSAIELFDNPNWSSGVRTIDFGTEVIERGPFYFEESVSECICTGQECEDNNCFEVSACFDRYEWDLQLENVIWTLPASHFSDRIRVSGVRNLSDFGAEVRVGSSVIPVQPGAEITFPTAAPNDVEVTAAISPTVTRFCGYKDFARRCPNQICPGCDDYPGEEDYPLASDCFSDYQESIQLRLECDVP